METKEIIHELRTRRGLSQDELAEKIFVTMAGGVPLGKQGETVPNVDTLKLLSKFFDVSINTLLGSPRQLVCQCCGMPLDDSTTSSKEPDDSFNEDYCKWCYSGRPVQIHQHRAADRFLRGAHGQRAVAPGSGARPHGGRRAEFEALEKMNSQRAWPR